MLTAPEGMPQKEARALQALAQIGHSAGVDVEREGVSVSVGVLAEVLGESATGVKRLLRELERDGVVATTYHFEAGRPSTYRINAQKLREYSPEMNRSKFERLLGQQKSSVRKVFEAVPIQAPWQQAKIMGELARTGINMDHKSVGFCLNELVCARLVKEGPTGFFVRTEVRDPEQSPKPETTFTETEAEEPMSLNNKPTPAAPTSGKPADAFGAFAAIADKLRKLADEVENAALEAESALQQAGAESKKLAELRNLLKGI